MLALSPQKVGPRTNPNFSHPHSYPLAIKLIATGKIDVKPLITQRYQIENALDGFNLLRNPGSQNVVKVLIQYDD